MKLITRTGWKNNDYFSIRGGGNVDRDERDGWWGSFENRFGWFPSFRQAIRRVLAAQRERERK